MINKDKKFLFLGIDSASWSLIIQLVKKGKLPGFRKLIKEGTITNLKSTNPPLTPVAWSSLYTGVNPGFHGIFDFYKLNDKNSMSFNLSHDRKTSSIFHLLSKANKRIAVANLPLTFPVEPINGMMISGFLTTSTKDNFIYPKSYKTEFMEKFPDYEFSEKTRFSYDYESKINYLQNLKKSVKEKTKLFNWLESKENWDALFVNFMEVDHVQHWFWKYIDKTHPKYEYHPQFSNAITHVYREIDRYLLKKINEGNFEDIIIFSDHGAGSYLKNINLNSLLLKNGLLKLKNNIITQFKYILFKLGITPQFIIKLLMLLNKLPTTGNSVNNNKSISNKIFLSLTDIDWNKSKAFSFGYYGFIYLIDKSNKNIHKVKKLLDGIEHEGNKVVTKIWNKEELYKGGYISNAADIIFKTKDYKYGSSAVTPFLSNQIISDPHTLKTGEHRELGIFAHYSLKNNKQFEKMNSITIPEVSATILDLLGINIPDYFDGKSKLNKKNNIEIEQEILDIDL